jgi:ribonuclease P/MRP protein subunit RPP1
MRVLRRCTLVVAEPSENHRLAALAAHYDLLAVRPASERALQQACQTLDAALISLDLTQRFPFHFRRPLLRGAIARGVRVELCYAPGIAAAAAADAMARRNVISNATQLIRATRGRGIVISSEARAAAQLRGPFDLVNLAAVWGLSSEQGREAVEREARAVVVMCDMKRTSWRGIIDIVDAGADNPLPAAKKTNVSNAAKPLAVAAGQKRAAAEPQMSKRQAKRARFEASRKAAEDQEKDKAPVPVPEKA